MKRNALIIFILTVLFQPIVCLGANEKISPEQAQAVVTRFVNINALPSSFYQVEERPELITNNSNEPVAYLFNLKPRGFVVVSAENRIKPVIAYSFQNNFSVQNFNEEKTALQIIKGIALNDKAIQNRLKNAEKITDAFETGPFVQSIWGQVNCHDNNGNLVNVTNYYTPNHYAPGCVAISMATLMHHYKWPVNGTGSHTYTDNRGSSTGTYSADFEGTFYSWINMLNKYNNQPSTDWQREAVGKLVFQTAVALEMNFEYNGSSSNVYQIPAAGKNYFRYSSLKRSFGSAAFWPLLDSNMMHQIPVIFAIKADNGAGHSIVCDGLRIEEDGTYYYHLNNGWWGSANGWYRIREGELGGGYDDIMEGVFYFLPVPALKTPVLADNAETVTLNWQYANTGLTVDAYELQQKIDDGSWETLSDEIIDTTYTVEVDPSLTYTFRVRAKVEGRWSTESWSTEEKMGYLSVNENSKLNNISFGPNPLVNYFSLYIPAAIAFPLTIKVLSLDGKTLFKADYNRSSRLQIDTQTWNSGVYLLILENKNSKRVVKIVKK